MSLRQGFLWLTLHLALIIYCISRSFFSNLRTPWDVFAYPRVYAYPRLKTSALVAPNQVQTLPFQYATLVLHNTKRLVGGGGTPMRPRFVLWLVSFLRPIHDRSNYTSETKSPGKASAMLVASFTTWDAIVMASDLEYCVVYWRH
jgi:hypothetical protein